ncbi:hypothetical protein SAZ11_33120 [Streptomyces sp. FXJ1.4098]|nr:hypothetical protein [Streptomyces sp. FXJ1.4098]
MSEHSATPASVVLSGYGPVGRAYVDHLAAHGEALADRHGARLRLAAVRTSSAEYLPPPAEGTDAEGTGDADDTGDTGDTGDTEGTGDTEDTEGTEGWGTWAPPPPRSAWGPLPSLAETLDRTGPGCWSSACPRPPRCATRRPPRRCSPCAAVSTWSPPPRAICSATGGSWAGPRWRAAA